MAVTRRSNEVRAAANSVADMGSKRCSLGDICCLQPKPPTEDALRRGVPFVVASMLALSMHAVLAPSKKGSKYRSLWVLSTGVPLELIHVALTNGHLEDPSPNLSFRAYSSMLSVPVLCNEVYLLGLKCSPRH